MFAITAIKGIGRRLANVACKKAEVDLAKRAGELSASELESLMVVVSNPRQFRVPDWFLNRCAPRPAVCLGLGLRAGNAAAPHAAASCQPVLHRRAPATPLLAARRGPACACVPPWVWCAQL